MKWGEAARQSKCSLSLSEPSFGGEREQSFQLSTVVSLKHAYMLCLLDHADVIYTVVDLMA